MPQSPSLACEGCGKMIWNSTSRVTNFCRECAKARIKHGDLAMYEKRKCRCDRCREAKRDSMRDYTRRRKEAGKPIRPLRHYVQSTCEFCGVEFKARRDPLSRFCSKECRVRARVVDDKLWRRKRMTPRGRDFRARAEKLAAEAAMGTTGGGLIWVNGPCGVCGQGFMSRGVSSRYCSKECRAVVRSLRTDWIDWRIRRSIYVRDSWRCQICRRESLLGAKDDSRPTLDHIVPRSKGGLHDPSNLRLLCSRCNSMRGDLTYYSDEDVRRAFSA